MLMLHVGSYYCLPCVLVPKVTIASLTGDSVTMDTEIDPYLENVPIKAEVLSVERLQWTQPFNPNV